MSINANTSVLEYERLTAERTQARLARKAINKRRYARQYCRRAGVWSKSFRTMLQIHLAAST